MLDTALTYTVWLADLSESLDRTRLLDGSPIVPGDWIIWRITDLEAGTMVPIQAYESEAEAWAIADALNCG